MHPNISQASCDQSPALLAHSFWLCRSLLHSKTHSKLIGQQIIPNHFALFGVLLHALIVKNKCIIYFSPLLERRRIWILKQNILPSLR